MNNYFLWGIFLLKNADVFEEPGLFDEGGKN
jgi:hypothetical protein